MTRRTSTVILTALVAVVSFTAAVLLYQRHERQQAAERAVAQSDVMVRPHSPVIGPVDAPVTIVEFFDPACEACRAFHPYVKQILTAFPREARLVIRYVPFHREPSVAGVQILEAARQQQRFGPVMDALLESQPVWASHNSPDPDRIRATPTFFVNGKPLPQPDPRVLLEMIRNEVARIGKTK